VFASGFLDPSANQNGEAFGIFAALGDGTVVPFPAYVPKARLQVIHNAADVAAASVDVYLMDGSTELLKLDDFAFRAATPFVDAPAGVDLSVIVAAPTSSGPTDGVITTIAIGQLADMEKYVVFANGLVTPGDYATNPDGAATAFELLVKPMARESAVSSNVEFFVLHGATDAPTVDVIARNVATLVNDAAYTDMTDYIEVPAASYVLDVTPGDDNNTIVASFEADLSGLAGGSAVVFASGFLDPSANQDGEAFGIFAALGDGTVVPFPAYAPQTAAPAPTIDQANVISLFSNSYSDVTVDTWSAVWDIADFQDIQIEGNDTKLYTNLLYAGIEFTSQTIDATEMTNFRMDIWTPDPTDSTDFKIKLVDFGADGAFAGGDDTEDELTFTAPLLKSGNWITIDIPLSDFAEMTSRSHLAQLIISGSINTVYVDNVFFYSKTPMARLQVIHNAADVAAASVDIYLMNDTTELIKLDDFAFRAATPFVDAPAGVDLSVIVALPTSTGPTDGVITTIPIGQLADMEKYVVFANGLVTPGDYASNPDGITTGFELLVKSMVREESTGNDVEFFVLHGATDAPAVDVIARDVATLVDNAAYTDITDYIPVPAASYILDVTPADDNETIVASFEADLSGLAGGSAVVFASGFLDPSANQNGEAFGIFAALADGNVVEFSSIITDIRDVDGISVPTNFSLKQNYPNPFNPSTVISFSLPKAENVTLKIYNILGSEITTLLNEELNAGNYSIDFNASNLASGTYFYKINAGNFTEVRKMNLIK
jgi:hypothetical protein